MKKIFFIFVLTLNVLGCSNSNSDANKASYPESIAFVFFFASSTFAPVALIEKIVDDGVSTSTEHTYYCGYPLLVDNQEITDEFNTNLGKGSATLIYSSINDEISINLNQCAYAFKDSFFYHGCPTDSNASIVLNGTLTSDVSDINGSSGTINIKGNIVATGFLDFTCEVDLSVVEIEYGDIEIERTEGTFCGYDFSDLIRDAVEMMQDETQEEQYCEIFNL